MRLSAVTCTKIVWRPGSLGPTGEFPALPSLSQDLGRGSYKLGRGKGWSRRREEGERREQKGGVSVDLAHTNTYTENEQETSIA